MDSLNYHSDELRNLAFEQTIIRLWMALKRNLNFVSKKQRWLNTFKRDPGCIHALEGKKSIKQGELIFFSLNILFFGLLFMIFYVPKITRLECWRWHWCKRLAVVFFHVPFISNLNQFNFWHSSFYFHFHLPVTPEIRCEIVFNLQSHFTQWSL